MTNIMTFFVILCACYSSGCGEPAVWAAPKSDGVLMAPGPEYQGDGGEVEVTLSAVTLDSEQWLSYATEGYGVTARGQRVPMPVECTASGDSLLCVAVVAAVFAVQSVAWALPLPTGVRLLVADGDAAGDVWCVTDEDCYSSGFAIEYGAWRCYDELLEETHCPRSGVRMDVTLRSADD